MAKATKYKKLNEPLSQSSVEGIVMGACPCGGNPYTTDELPKAPCRPWAVYCDKCEEGTDDFHTELEAKKAWVELHS